MEKTKEVPVHYPSTITCGICSKKLERLIERKTPPWEGMWSGGTVVKFQLGYGSSLDGDNYYIAMCDDCIEDRAEFLN
jgi:hypothetical protein